MSTFAEKLESIIVNYCNDTEFLSGKEKINLDDVSRLVLVQHTLIVNLISAFTNLKRTGYF